MHIQAGPQIAFGPVLRSRSAPSRSSWGNARGTCGRQGTNEADRRRLQAYVAQGRGLLTSGLGWGWKQLHPGKHLATDHPGKRLLAPMGIAFADGTLKKTGRVGYVTPGVPNALVDAPSALDAIRDEERAKAVPKEGLAQVSLTLTSALDSLHDWMPDNMPGTGG